MAGVTTTKVLDTTVISACIDTIVTVDILDICCSQYRATTSKSVYDEAVLGFPKNAIEGVFRKVSVETNYDEEQYKKILSFLRNRYPYLGEGELSIVVVAILAYDMNGVPSYVVSDDMRFKKKFSEILEAPPVGSILGTKKCSVRVTGTIGLVRQLFRRGRVSPEMMRCIISDIQKGTLYISDKLMDELGECLR